MVIKLCFLVWVFFFFLLLLLLFNYFFFFVKVSELVPIPLVEWRATHTLFCIQEAPASTDVGSITPLQLHVGYWLD